MYLVDRNSKQLQQLEIIPFSSAGFRERQDLQEWLAANPKALGEDLLIIQKEFAGFSDTRERLDLLALDKEGNLVVIENKLDDSGRDVTWQALKYASYCSTLTNEQIREIFQDYLRSQGIESTADEKLSEFFGGVELVLNQKLSQRIILVSGSFRKEVTSTVLFLLSRQINIKCFKATLYALDEQNFLTVDQIIPTPDTQDYMISMAAKEQKDHSAETEIKTRHSLRLQLWPLFLSRMKGTSTLFQNTSPTKDQWLTYGAGTQGVSYQVTVTSDFASVLLNFGRAAKAENKSMFAEVEKYKAAIEEAFGAELNWELMPDRKSSRVSYAQPGLNYFNTEDWPAIVDFLATNIVKLEASIKDFLRQSKYVLSSSVEIGEEFAE